MKFTATRRFYILKYGPYDYSFLSFGAMMSFRRYCMTQFPDRVGKYRRINRGDVI